MKMKRKRFNWKLLNYFKNGIISILCMVFLDSIWWNIYEDIWQKLFTNILIPANIFIVLYMIDELFKIFIVGYTSEQEKGVQEDEQELL